MTTAYRDDLPALLHRRDELLRGRAAEVEREAPELVELLSRRRARQVAGLVATAGGVAMAAAAFASMLGSGGYPRSGALTYLLVSSWAVAFAVWCIARHLAGRALQTRLAAWCRATADARADVDRLQRQSPLESARRRIDALEVASIAAPLFGAAMLLPLSVHLLVSMLLEGRWDPTGFDRWIELSVMLVGHVHLVFGAMCWRYARRLRAAGADFMRGSTAEAYIALAAAALAAVVPTIVFAPVYVLLTGAVPAPILFWLAQRAALRERAQLGVWGAPAAQHDHGWLPPRLDRPQPSFLGIGGDAPRPSA